MKRPSFIRRGVLAMLPGLCVLAFSGCALTKPAIQEGQVAGIYSAVTDFSRDIQNMNGAKETMIYKNGREEKLKFLPGHKFIKTIHYSSDRVADQIVMGQWELADNQLIHAFGNEAAGSFSEYYQLDRAGRDLIRLDEHKQKLAPEYAPYFTYRRQTANNLSTGSK